MPDDATLKIFFVYAPYQTDAEIQTRRMEVRPRHLEHMSKLIDAGILRTSARSSLLKVLINSLKHSGVGGVLSDPKEVGGKPGDAMGSTMVVKYKSVEEVKSMLESDAYYAGNVVCINLYELSAISLLFVLEVGQRQPCHSSIHACRPPTIRRYITQLHIFWPRISIECFHAFSTPVVRLIYTEKSIPERASLSIDVLG